MGDTGLLRENTQANFFLCHIVAGNEQSDSGPHTHHHQATNGQTSSSSPNDVQPAQNFYPTFPTSASLASSTLSSSHDGLGGHMASAGRAPHSSNNPAAAVAVAVSKQEDSAERDRALFGEIPETKRRKFILVDDAQRGTRVRVRVMLDQVQMEEMPDSYRKSNSVYPRSYFAVQMQSPPPSPRGGGRFPDDEDTTAEDGGSGGATLVPVPMLDGSEAKVPLPRMSRAKRSKEVTLNDLGYRMSWSQSRVFSGRTLFLQRSRKFFLSGR